MAVNLRDALLNAAIQAANLSPSAQQTLARFSAVAAPLVLPFETKQVSFEPHPLHTLCHLVENTQQPARLRETLNRVPEKLRNAVFYHVWDLATDPVKKGEKWGEERAFENLPRLIQAIHAVAVKRLQELPLEKKYAVYGTIYRMSGQPETRDLRWGEHNATTDLKKLICALHRTQNLDIPGKEIKVCVDLEKDLKIPSHFFHLNRRELNRGQIGFHNGMYNSKEHAFKHALRLSDACAQGFNLHCTYSATVNLSVDTASAVLGQGGVITPPVVHLLEQWLDFFERSDSVHLQICHSRGAIEVYNALNELPSSLQQKIVVITIAPACLIPPSHANQVINLVIEADPVVKMAANRELLDTEAVVKLHQHEDTYDTHDMHGSSYREKLVGLIDCYIRTNKIF